MANIIRISLALLLQVPPAGALELFGVELESAGRGELSAAVGDAGATLVREGGGDAWFDVYDSSAVLPGSKRLYLGFVKREGRFAFAEYEFVGLVAKRLLRDLRAKYGPPTIRGGRFISDRSYHWRRGGIDISLVSDWPNYRSRLSYVVPDNLAELQAERAAVSSPAEAGEVRISLY